MYIRSMLCVALLLGFCQQSWATKPLFNSKEPLTAVLSTPLTQLYKQKKQEVRLYQDGTLSYLYGDAASNKLNLTVRTRGNYRRLNCKHPPLRLNFKKKANDSTLFERQNKLKLVGQCKNGPKFEQYVGLEYIVYQIWEELSEYHFKTRLVNLSYVDTDGKMKPRTTTTFLIEEIDDVAKRSKRINPDDEKVSRAQLDFKQAALLELFEFFIGNTDYSTLTGPPGNRCCHNVRLIAKKNVRNGMIPIPYDFDVSGFVNAPYATPAAQYPIKTVRQRYYSGLCKQEHNLEFAIQRFNDRKNNIYDIVNNSGLLSKTFHKNTIKYLDAFYKTINNPARVEREIIKRCRGSLLEG